MDSDEIDSNSNIKEIKYEFIQDSVYPYYNF